MELSRLQGKLLAEGLHNVSNIILMIRELKGMSFTSLPSLGKLSLLRRLSVNGLDEVKEASAETNSTLEILMIADMPGGSSTSPLLNLCEFLTVPKSKLFPKEGSPRTLGLLYVSNCPLLENGAKRVAEFRIQPFGRLTNFDVPQHLVDRHRDFKVLNPSSPDAVLFIHSLKSLCCDITGAFLTPVMSRSFSLDPLLLCFERHISFFLSRFHHSDVSIFPLPSSTCSFGPSVFLLLSM
ncbi:hypothetical protein Peur_034287 [Populus x canadensis]